MNLFPVKWFYSRCTCMMYEGFYNDLNFKCAFCSGVPDPKNYFRAISLDELFVSIKINEVSKYE